MKHQIHGIIMEAFYYAAAPQIMDYFHGLVHDASIVGEGDTWPPVFDKDQRKSQAMQEPKPAETGR